VVEDESTAVSPDRPPSGGPARIEDDAAAAALAFDAVVDEMIAEFSVSEVATQEGEDPPAFSSSPRDDEGDILAELELADGMDREVEVEVPAIAIVPRPVPSAPEEGDYEPLDVGDDLYPGIAHALNRGAEGIEEPAPADADVPEGRSATGTGTRLS